MLFSGIDNEYKKVYADTKEPTGFINGNNDVGLSLAGGTLTVAPAISSFSYYIKGVKYTKTASEQIVLQDTEGIHFVYYDGNTLLTTTTFTTSLFFDYAIVSVIYWDAINSKQIYLGRECHGCVMDGATHSYLHSVVGFALSSGGGLGNILVDQNGDDNEDAQFSNEATLAYDEDLEFSHLARSKTTNIPVYYRSGLDASNIWRVDETASFGVLTTGTGMAAWNELVGGSWQLTESTNNDFVLAHVFVWNDTDRPYAVIMGQAEYNTIGNARDGAEVEVASLILSGLQAKEFKFLGSIIYQTSNSYGNDVKSRIRSTDGGFDCVDLRDLGLSSGGSSAVVNDHGALTGLGDDDHLQYLNETRFQDLAGINQYDFAITNGSIAAMSTDIITVDVVDSDWEWGQLFLRNDASTDYSKWGGVFYFTNDFTECISHAPGFKFFAFKGYSGQTYSILGAMPRVFYRDTDNYSSDDFMGQVVNVPRVRVSKVYIDGTDVKVELYNSSGAPQTYKCSGRLRMFKTVWTI